MPDNKLLSINFENWFCAAKIVLGSRDKVSKLLILFNFSQGAMRRRCGNGYNETLVAQRYCK